MGQTLGGGARRFALGGAVAAGVAFALVACGSVKDRGELMLAMQTDLELPKDVDDVRIEVTSFGKTLFAQDYPVGPGGVKIPATLGVVGDPNSPSTPIEIRVIATQGGTYRVLRNVTTTVPPDRTAILRMPLAWLCWNQVSVDSTNTPQSSCPTGQTCIAGECTSNALDSTQFQSFDPTLVFGGSTDASGGECLDTIACFANGVLAAVDPSDCSIPMPASGGQGINVAMIRKAGVPGICSAEACYVPLDQDATEGWSESGDKIRLPPAVCNRLTSPSSPNLSILGVAVTTSCATKTPSVPTCGPWSSVGGSTATFEAGTPAGFDAGPNTDFAGTWFSGGTYGEACNGELVSTTLTITQASDGSYSVDQSVGPVTTVDGTCEVVTQSALPATLQADGTLTYTPSLTSFCSCASATLSVSLALTTGTTLTSTESFANVAECPSGASGAEDASSPFIDATALDDSGGGGSGGGGADSGSGSGAGSSFCATCGSVSCAVVTTFNRTGGGTEDAGTTVQSPDASTAEDGGSGDSGSPPSADSGVLGECGPANCAGCCDATGACQDGFSNTACGEDGTTCSSCASLAQTCAGSPAQCSLAVVDAGKVAGDGGP